jgi:twitching motility protein PilT
VSEPVKRLFSAEVGASTESDTHLAIQVPAPAAPPRITQLNSNSQIDMKYLVKALVKYHASDLHLKVGRPPLFRINGKLISSKMADMKQSEAEAIILGVLSEKQMAELEIKRQIDFSFRVQDLGRFRCNVYYQRGTISAAIRMIPITVPNIDSLGVPSVLKDLCNRPRGLVLVTGPTGSGKSTTLASMIQYINEHRPVHVLAIEDPIEYVYRDQKASITQREVGSDTSSINDALIAGLRQDPDVIMIGELREVDTIKAALTAAETGHLVLSTLHTYDAKSTIDRILDVFQPDAQNQVRIQLGATLAGVVSQQLITRADGSGLVPACEVMIKSPAIENYILKNETTRIPAAIASSTDYYKMQSMNQALERLVKNGVIKLEDALKASNNPDDLRLKLAGLDREEGYKAN